jgi:hypothetical protein
MAPGKGRVRSTNGKGAAKAHASPRDERARSSQKRRGTPSTTRGVGMEIGEDEEEEEELEDDREDEPDEGPENEGGEAGATPVVGQQREEGDVEGEEEEDDEVNHGSPLTASPTSVAVSHHHHHPQTHTHTHTHTPPPPGTHTLSTLNHPPASPRFPPQQASDKLKLKAQLKSLATRLAKKNVRTVPCNFNIK